MAEQREGHPAGSSSSLNSVDNEKTGVSRPSDSDVVVEAVERNWIDAREGYQVMASHLWKSCRRRDLFSENPEVASAVAIRFTRGQYVVCPPTTRSWLRFAALWP